MPKTDKELTAEIVCAFMQMKSGQGKISTSNDELLALINDVFETLHALPENDD